jgi:predicted RNA-binding Zn-ribbon protein involved in translation (DUF1610 family)
MSEQEILTEVCKNCAGKLEFAPGTDHLKCPYCGTENVIVTSGELIEELDFEKFVAEFEKDAPVSEVATVKCSGCGAETTFNPNVVSDNCPFCGSPQVVKEATTTHKIKPKALLPFSISRENAFDQFRSWISKLWFAPDKLKRFARQQEKLSGMYIPYWTYDSNTSSDYQGERGTDYHTTERYTTTENGRLVNKTRTVTRTSWTPVSGHVDKSFDDVLSVASKTLPREYVEKLEPWGTENLVPFNEQYLSGFKTESYQLDLRDGFEDAKIKMDSSIRQSVCRDIGGDHQKIHSLRTIYNNITFKHILMPVWISAYSYKNKVYRFLINGRTGEVQGERPYSAAKITLAVLAAIVLIAFILLLANK